MFKLVHLLNTERYIVLFNLGTFIFDSMKIRSYYTIIDNTYVYCVICVPIRTRSSGNTPHSLKCDFCIVLTPKSCKAYSKKLVKSRSSLLTRNKERFHNIMTQLGTHI